MPVAVAQHPARASLRRALTAVWRQAVFVDRLYVCYFAGLSALVVVQRHRIEDWPAFLALHAGGLAVVAAAIQAAHRRPWLHAWYPVLMPLVTFPEIARLNLMFADGWRDAHLLAAESWLFPESPTFWLRRVVPPLAAELFQIGYLSYFLLLVVVAGLFRRRGQDASFRGVIAASVLAYLFCYVVFVAVPMEGPVHTLRHLSGPPPFEGPFLALVRLVQRAGVHGNAFPSAHVAGALPPVIFACRHAPRLGAVMMLLVALMGLGAVYDGYHYVSDVVAGIAVGAAAAAIVMAVQGSPEWARRLRLPAAAGSGEVRTSA
jgi:membrane-associated phospholipid phosphatase